MRLLSVAAQLEVPYTMPAKLVDDDVNVVTMKQFLEEVPPGQTVFVSDLNETKNNNRGGFYYPINLPVLNLYCGTPVTCEGIRLFRSQSEANVTPNQHEQRFLTYVCKNCSASIKIFAIRVRPDGGGPGGVVWKFGEMPAFGPPLPARLLRLLGDDAGLFLKGRIAENQGLGIAAFAYYRRVVENQKGALLDELIRVSKVIGANSDVVAGLEKAKSGFQFAGAVEEVQAAIPPALLINNENPLTLLHNAFSRGLHAGSDAECLNDATAARVVLAEMVRRMADAMKDEAEIKSSVSRLSKVRAKDS